MTLVELLLVLLALPGHAAFWIWLSNRLHALAIPQWMVDVVANGCLLAMLSGAVGMFGLVAWPLVSGSSYEMPAAVTAYLVLCTLVTVGPLAWSMWARYRTVSPAALLSNHTSALNLADRVGAEADINTYGRIVVRIPGNEVLRLEVNRKELEIARLGPELDGFSIAHLSDFHFTRRIPKEWFSAVVDEANALGADMVAVTGDIVDHAPCIEWIADTLGRLQAPLGVYFVLGNHDLLPGVHRVRAAMKEAGLIDLGGRWLTVEHRQQRLLLAGNELPWIAPAADLRDAPQEFDLRILLSHTPDQIPWARAHGFDLVLAGHTHGGQIRMPILGPIVAPSKYGVRYASGVFHEPPCMMHVSRGLSGKIPLRFNCPPELAAVVLRSRR